MNDKELNKTPIRILIAEDLISDAQLAQREINKSINKAHYHVVETREDFLEALQNFLPDIVISDYKMPSFDGITAIQITHDFDPRIPVIIHTGSMDEDTAVGCMKAGAADYVIKEHVKRLGVAVVHALENKRVKAEKLLTQQALVESESRFRRLAENANDLIYRYEFFPVPGFSYVSPSSTRIVGYTPEEHYADPMLGMKIAHPDDQHLLVTRANLDSNPNIPVTMRWITKAGEIIVMEQKNTLLTDESGKVIAIEGIARDISYRKKAEDELRENAYLLEIAGKLGSIGGWSVDLLANKVKWSNVVADIHEAPHGFSPSVEEGISFYAPESREKIIEVYTACVQQGIPYDEELQIVTTKGKRVWVRAIGVAEVDKYGVVEKVHGGFQDITQKKIAEKTLQESEYRYRLLFQNNPVPMWVYDLETLYFLAVNETAIACYGYSKEEFLQMKITMIRPPSELERLLNHISSTDKTIQESGPWKHQYKDGTIIEVEIHSHSIVFDGKNARLVMALDISDRVEKERQIQEKNEEIAMKNEEYQLINESLMQANVKLQAALLQAQESDQLKTSFLNNMSHEIRTPLNGIIGFSELLCDSNIGHEDREKYYSFIEQNSNDLMAVVTNIVQLSQIETGQEKVNMKPFAPDKSFRELLAAFQQSHRKTTLSFEFVALHEFANLAVVSDEAKIKTIIQQLLDNAFKFTSYGTISLHAAYANEHLILKVKDTGIGIDPKYHDVIFDRFRKLEHNNNVLYRGNGLGLTIVKSLCKLLDANIAVESEIGKGATFVVIIPVQPIASDTQMPAFNFETLPRIKKILVVEDEEDNSRLLELLFRNSGAVLLLAINGHQAIKMVQDDPSIDLVLMDLRLPLMDGFEATRRICEIRPGLVVIAQTAYAHQSDIIKAIQAGCKDVIVKPLSKAKLRGLIDKVEKREHE